VGRGGRARRVARHRRRDFCTLLWLAALALALPGTWLLLETPWVPLAWSALAVGLAWLSARGREPRLELASLVLLGLGLAVALVELAPPADLLLENSSPASGVPALLPVLAGLLAALRLAPELGATALAPALGAARRYGPWLAAALGLYAASLATLGLAAAVGSADVATEFQRGHTAVSALWGIVGVAALVAGLRLGRRGVRLAGFVLLFASLAKLFLYDLSALSSVARALSFLAVGVLLLVAGFFYQRLSGALD
jgi:uncharacterized membrane protein